MLGPDCNCLCESTSSNSSSIFGTSTSYSKTSAEWRINCGGFYYPESVYVNLKNFTNSSCLKCNEYWNNKTFIASHVSTSEIAGVCAVLYGFSYFYNIFPGCPNYLELDISVGHTFSPLSDTFNISCTLTNCQKLAGTFGGCLFTQTCVYKITAERLGTRILTQEKVLNFFSQPLIPSPNCGNAGLGIGLNQSAYYIAIGPI